MSEGLETALPPALTSPASIAARARARLSDQELFELGVCCASWLGLGRMTQIFDAGVSCRIEL
jgi:hypothetical protein